jgi:hypothetical protein
MNLDDIKKYEKSDNPDMVILCKEIRRLIFDCEIHMVERYKLEANVSRLSRELRECRGEDHVIPPHYYHHHHHDDCHDDYYENEG